MEPERKGMEASLCLLQVIASLADCRIHSPLPMSRNSTLKGNCSHASHSSHLRLHTPYKLQTFRLSQKNKRISLCLHRSTAKGKKEGEKGGGEREKVNMNLCLLSFYFFLENLSIQAFHLTP